MNTKDLIRLGEPLAHEFIQNFIAQGNDGALNALALAEIMPEGSPAPAKALLEAFQSKWHRPTRDLHARRLDLHGPSLDLHARGRGSHAAG